MVESNEYVGNDAAISLLKEIFQASFQGLIAAGKRVVQKSDERDLWGRAARKYVKKIEERYNTIRIMGMNEPISLRKLYVRVNVLEKIRARQRLSIESLEKQFDRDTRRFGDTVFTKPASELINQEIFKLTKHSIRLLRDDKIPGEVIDVLQKMIPTARDIHTNIVTSTDDYSINNQKSRKRVEPYLLIQGKRQFREKLKHKLGLLTIKKYETQIFSRTAYAHKIIVLGKPGAGKTTLLKFLTIQSLDGNTQVKRIPIFVGLKDFSDSERLLIDFIVDQFDVCNFPDATPFVKRLLEKGKCLVLFDGLDEVSENKQSMVIKEVRDISDRYSENLFVISCRTAAYNYVFEKFTDIEMADFDDNQIRNFILNWFGHGTKKARVCWKELNLNRSIKELAVTPLLLALLCITFDETMVFPSNRSELYKEAIDALLRKWDASKGIARAEIYKHLSTRRKETLLSQLAAETFVNDQYFFKRQFAEKMIADFIQHLPEAKETKIEADSEVILKAIESQHGILVERAANIYSFSHLTFQEYFTALYIANQLDTKVLSNLADRYLFDDKWREVILLTAGMLHQADDFLWAIRSKLSKLARNLNIVPFFSHVNKIMSKETPYPPYVSRVLIMKYIFSVNRARERNYLDYLQVIEQCEIIVQKIAPAAAPALARDHTIPSDFSFDPATLQSINKYFKGATMLVETLYSECYISRDSRHQLLESLFAEPLTQIEPKNQRHSLFQ